MSALADFTFAIRQIRRYPGVAATAIISLMLGIGAATAVFRDVNSLMSIRVSEPGPRGGRTGYTVDHFIDLREHSSIFEGLTASTISDVFWTTAVQIRSAAAGASLKPLDIPVRSC